MMLGCYTVYVMKNQVSMQRLLPSNIYPGNVLSAVFGEKREECFYYCDKGNLDRMIAKIMRDFSLEDNTVFYSLYKDKVAISEIASELQCSEETVNYMHLRILRTLRHLKFAKQLASFTNTVAIYNDGDSDVNELLKFCAFDDTPVAVTRNGEVVAFVINPELYSALSQKLYSSPKVN